MVARRKVGVNDMPTKYKMNIYLLNIPFAIVGVAIAIVPLLIGMKHQSRGEVHDAATRPVVDVTNDLPVKEYEHAA